MPELEIEVDPTLAFLLPRARRAGRFSVERPMTDTLGHVVTALGIPLTEVGRLVLDGAAVPASVRVAAGSLQVRPVRRPQRTSPWPPRFLLDVHLGRLARRLRLLGLDAAYDTHAEDADLAERAGAEHRVLLTQDRGLLHRRAVPVGALVRGDDVRDQLDDVLDRFAPPLEPWSRCLRCGAHLAAASAADVAELLEPGTRRTYAEFARCTGCGRVYWRGAHAAPLEAVVARAEATVARRRPAADRRRPG